MSSKRAELETIEATAVEPYRTPPVAELMKLAIDKNISVEAIEKLVMMNERIADRAAAQEFADALAEFQNSCPPIKKGSKAKIVTKGGGSYGYTFADLDTIVRTIRKPAHDHGLSWSWDSSIDGNMLTAICTLRHTNGHSISGSFSCPTTSASAMSEQQKAASALTFARRQSLVQVLGLTTTDQDYDGGAAHQETGECITEHEAADIRAVFDEYKWDIGGFHKHFKVDAVENLPKSKFLAAMDLIKRKRAQG